MVSLPILETLVSVITTVMGGGGLAALFFLMIVESFGFPPLPSEIILPFAGFLIYSGDYSWAGGLLAALAGGLVGSFIAYAVGRWGRHLLERPSGYLRLNPKHMRAMDDWFRRHGEGTVIISRMLPIVRSYISYPAGTARMDPTRFGVYTIIGAIPFTAALMYAGYSLGPHWSVVESYFHLADYVAAVGLVLLIVYIALLWRGVITSDLPPKLVRNPPPAPPMDPKGP
jgi:membrane protein DedA with SNARE-associated domain